MPPHYSGCCHGAYANIPFGPCGSGPHYGMWPAFWDCLYITPRIAHPFFGCGCVGPGQVPYATFAALPKELEANPAVPSSEVIVGGSANVQISLEFMRGDGAEVPSVKLAVSSAGSSSTWEDAAIADGYHVKGDFPKISPGSRIKVTVQNAIARARWFETLASGVSS